MNARRHWLEAAAVGIYDLSWLPEATAAKMVATTILEGGVVLRLATGAWIVDRLDSVEFSGPPGTVTPMTVAETAIRRRWDAVEVHGQLTLRRAVAIRLAAIEPPMVIYDTPLTEQEIEAARRLPRRRGPTMFSQAEWQAVQESAPRRTAIPSGLEELWASLENADTMQNRYVPPDEDYP